ERPGRHAQTMPGGPDRASEMNTVGDQPRIQGSDHELGLRRSRLDLGRAASHPIAIRVRGSGNSAAILHQSSGRRPASEHRLPRDEGARFVGGPRPGTAPGFVWRLSKPAITRRTWQLPGTRSPEGSVSEVATFHVRLTAMEGDTWGE